MTVLECRLVCHDGGGVAVKLRPYGSQLFSHNDIFTYIMFFISLKIEIRDSHPQKGRGHPHKANKISK